MCAVCVCDIRYFCEFAWVALRRGTNLDPVDRVMRIRKV